jgi:hypothetical protein
MQRKKTAIDKRESLMASSRTGDEGQKKVRGTYRSCGQYLTYTETAAHDREIKLDEPESKPGGLRSLEVCHL